MLDLVHHRIRVGGIVELQVHYRGLILAAGQILQGAQGKEFPPTLSTLDKAADGERVVENLDRVPALGMLGLRKKAVPNHIIRPSKRTPLKIVAAPLLA